MPASERAVYDYHLSTIERSMRNLLRYAQNVRHENASARNMVEIGYQMGLLYKHMLDCTPPWALESEYTHDTCDGVVEGILEFSSLFQVTKVW